MENEIKLMEMANGKNDVELSAIVMAMEAAGTLVEFCKANNIKAGRKRDYRGAAFSFLQNLRDHLAL